MLLPIDQLDDSAARAPEPANGLESLTAPGDFDVERATTTPDKGAILPPEVNLEKRKEMLEVSSSEPVDFAYERVIGKNDAVYSNFVDLIEIVKRKVGKVVVKDGSHNTACATGFLVSDQLLLTNWHVFNTKEDVKDSEVEFFYEYDIEGDPKPVITYRLDADTFFYSSKELDYCFVAVNSTDITGKYQLSEMGYIYLDPAIGKLGNVNEEKLNIIHHPDGDYKQLSIRENLFVKVTDTTIWYQTDTAQGSSGSPVFNDQWQVVALHHMGVALKNDQGQYIDQNKNPIPVINNKIDSTKVVWIANEGIRISVLLANVFAQFPDNKIIAGLKVNAPIKASEPPASQLPTESKPIEPKETTTTIMNSTNSDTIQLSIPASLMNAGGSITVSITNNNGQKPQAIPSQPAQLTASASDEELMLEEEDKKLENATDYSLCKGYQLNFLGNGSLAIPMPLPTDKIKKFTAKLTGSTGIVLKYYNYSTVFHSVRMMPIISCINVAGDPGERMDNQKRQDNWLRDSRLSFDIQLSDAWYRSSGFDRGHMSRREDANWGTTAADALRNANLTCMYTNACPQVPKINRPDGGKSVGLWGKLEQIVLEKGIEKEVGKTSKVSVFNGPIFQNDDPVYKGIQVPMDFFKIIVWPTDSGSLKATAFRLSQTKLVSNIDFEEIDIDQNTDFKAFQVSIGQLALDTNIDFSAIESLDTFAGTEASSSEITAETIKHHISSSNR